MKLGAEPQKVALLVVLVVALGFAFWQNVLGPGDSETIPPPRPVTPAAGSAPSPAATETPRPSAKKRESRDFRPSFKKRPDEADRDPMTIDPTLRLDLLAKLQTVTYTGAGRNLFEFSNAPTATPEPAKSKTPDPKIAFTLLPRPAGPEWPPPAPPPPPPPPQAPPIPLKFYGYSGELKPGATGKRAFFLDGEEILVAGEGEIMKRRYKVVRINAANVEMEDIQFPGQKQTLPLVLDPNA